VLEQFPNNVKLVFKNFPLRNHPYAMKAAIAALAAGNQGKFWEFHDLLVKNYDRLSDEKIKEMATSLNLDEKKFEEDLKGPKIKNKIRQDQIDGINAGVRSTPTIFINGRLLRNRSLEGFRELIEKDLKK
jgi:protein-disulfide isomerase